MTSTRKDLSDAIAARALAAKLLAETDAAVEGARRFVAGIEAEVASFDDVEARVTAERAAEVRTVLAKGGVPTFRQSPDLAAAVVAKAEAESRLAAARSASAHLGRDAEDARAAMTRAEQRVWDAVEMVIAEEAASRAAELDRLSAEVLGRQIELHGVGWLMRKGTVPNAFVRVDGAVIEQIRRSDEGEVGLTGSPSFIAAKEFRSRWIAFADALESDPDAKL